MSVEVGEMRKNTSSKKVNPLEQRDRQGSKEKRFGVLKSHLPFGRGGYGG